MYYRYTIDKKLKEHTETLADQATSIAGILLSITGIGSRLSAVEATASENRQLITTMQSNISAHTIALNDLFSRVGTLETNYTSLDARVTALENE